MIVATRKLDPRGAARLPVVTTTAGPRDTRLGSRSRSLVLFLATVLPAILTLLTGSAGSANASTTTASVTLTSTGRNAPGPPASTAETRVGASTVAAGSFVVVTDGVAAGLRRGERSLRPGFVSASSVAAESESGLASATRTCLRSFAGTTLVLMADGSKEPIEDIKVGDKVVATDPETGERVARRVTHVWVHNDQLTDLAFADGARLTTTEDHYFWSVTDGIFERSDQLALGEVVLGDHGQHLTVTGFRAGTTSTALAYNLSIAGVHTYHVGPDAILVHNTCGPGDEVHNVLNAADRGVDVGHVWQNGDLYTQVRGEETRLVRVLSQGNGQNAVVIRELDGTPVTSMMISDESLAARIADGRWQ